MNCQQSGAVVIAGKRKRSGIQSVRQKITRLQAGAKPRVLDLFAGCGGLSLGFQAAGCEIAAAIEFDEDAARSHGTNFHPKDASHAEARDITKTPPKKLTEALGLGRPEAAFDIVVGGPPCQAFTRVGRSKLREVADHPEAFRHDSRARLYIEYIEYVKACAPLAVVLENVPDMLNFAGHNIAHEICEVLSGIGYACSYTLLNAAMYGVPQMRERAFLVAIHREVTDTISFPKPTHKVVLPPGYEGTRAVALKLLADSDPLDPNSFWKPTPESDADVLQATTVRQALEDLPVINAQAELESGRLKRGARRFDIPVPYQHVADISDYARLMRKWPGMSTPDVLRDHVIRYLPRDYKLFARLSPGDQYPEAYRMASVMFEERLVQRRAAGDVIEEGADAWLALKASIVPPYDHTKFPNKWRKMEPDRPARTLMAHLGKDSYSHIHYDNAQARPISVREAARLQSFPDGFVFCGTMNPAFRQIGNAVPPLLAKAIGTELLTQIRTALAAPARKTAAAGR
jgi:DNA (cytosine-5)-methyltransferase 1